MRMQQPLRTTQDVVAAIGRPGKPSKGKGKGAKHIHPATRVFQVQPVFCIPVRWPRMVVLGSADPECSAPLCMLTLA